MNSLTVTSKFAAALVAAGLSFAVPAPSFAVVGEDSCGEGNAACRFTVDFNGQPVGAGTFDVASDGTIMLPNDFRVDLPGGASAGVTDMFGNADPLLGFAGSASTGGVGGTFAYNFFLPINLNGTIASHGEIGYSLTATTAAGAQIAPSDPPPAKVLKGRDVDTSVGGKTPIDKKLDAGDTFFFLDGPATHQSITYKGDGAFVVDSAYDTMSATVSFALSPNSNVGFSGFIQQTVVPEVSTYGMLLAGLFLVGFVARRRLGAS